MKVQALLLGASALTLTGCSQMDESLRAMEANRQAIEWSTCVINENAQAIEQVNHSLEENRRQMNAINQTLEKIKAESN